MDGRVMTARGVRMTGWLLVAVLAAGVLAPAGHAEALRLRVVEADRLEADLGPERYHLEGRVRLERAGEDGRVSRLTAARLTYQALQGEAWAEGAVRLEEEDRWFAADQARFWDRLGQAELAGRVSGEWSTGAVESAERVTVVLETGEITLFGPAELLFQVEEDPRDEPSDAGS